MILRFLPDATEEQRAAVLSALDRLDVEERVMAGMLLLDRDLSDEESVLVASMPGVESLSLSDPATVTVRENFLRWTAASALVLGILVLIAANLPSHLGPPADPLVTPGDLHPAWPMMAWYTLVNRLPGAVPVPLFILLAAVLLVAWPFLARKLAEKSPVLHGLVGAAVLVTGAVLAFMEMVR